MKNYSNENIEKRKKVISTITLILKILLTIIIVPILLVNCILILKALMEPNKTPDILGFKSFVVVSGSMEPEINVGDLIIVNKNKKPSIGDIITYKNGEVITHRVVNTTQDNKYITKGDNNESPDNVVINEESFEGTYVCKIPAGGKFLIYLQNPFVLMAVIMLILAFYSNSKTIDNRKIMRRQKRISHESKKKPS